MRPAIAASDHGSIKACGKAEEKKRKADDKIAEGKAKASSAEESYKRCLSQLTPATDPQGAFAQSDGLKDAAKRWQKAIEQIRNGEKDVRNAQEDMAKASRGKAEGEALMAEGRAMKAQAGDIPLVPSLVPAAVTPPTP